MQKIKLADGVEYNVLEITKGQKMNPKLKQLRNTITFHISGTTYAELREKFCDELCTKEIKVILDTGYEMQPYVGYGILIGLCEDIENRVISVTMMESSTLEDDMKQMQKNVERMKEEIQSGRGIKAYSAVLTLAQIQAQNLSDEQALTVKVLYKDWGDDPEEYPYKTSNPDDKRRNYNGKLWNLNKDHNKQANWYPGADPTLWTEIVEGHAGTLEDPIPVPDSVTTSGFEYEYGKYYSEGDTVYLMDRTGMNTGETVRLYFAPSSMIGQYFSAVG